MPGKEGKIEAHRLMISQVQQELRVLLRNICFENFSHFHGWRVSQCFISGCPCLLYCLGDRAGVLFSCGGGMPPGVSTENIEAFLETAAETW